MSYYTKRLNGDLWNDFQSFFEFKGKCSGCWCMNHRLPIGLDFEGEAAKLAMKDLVESNRVFGILAYSECEEIPIGWTSLDRKKTLPGHDCIGDKIDIASNIWSIHCVTVRPDYKNKGIEEMMILAALESAKEMNASEVESYPEPKSRKGMSYKTWNTFNGHEDTYSEIGFKVVDINLGESSNFYQPMTKHIGGGDD
jgi:GNAT superfamily N-acetyltransferase